jgi:tripartite-type tricarboxylate transporter receptor subunit TctC
MTKTIIRRAAMAALLLVAPVEALAQANYPEKPIHLIVGFPAGSAVDTVARLIAPKLAESLGKPVVIENVLGAAGNVASDRVVKAAPDGHTLALAANAQIIMNPSLYRLPYDTATAFAPISQVVASPNLLVVSNASRVKSFRELVALAKAQPGALTYATGGVGSSPHMAGALLNSVAGLDIRHVPYKGVVAALPDLFAERVTMMFSPIPIVLPAVREARLRALATTSLKRTAALRDIPTVAESGLPGFDVTTWLGLMAPVGTPTAVIRRLHQESTKVLAMAEVAAKLKDLGMDVIGNAPDEFADVIKSEIPLWAKVIKEAGVQPE